MTDARKAESDRETGMRLKQGTGSRDKLKHTERNDQLSITRMM